jgi:hypothetical protein
LKVCVKVVADWPNKVNVVVDGGCLRWVHAEFGAALGASRKFSGRAFVRVTCALSAALYNATGGPQARMCV